MYRIVLSLIMITFFSSSLFAIERLLDNKVNSLKLMDEVYFESPDDDNLTMGWWMPSKVFYLCYLHDDTETQDDIKEIQSLLHDKLVLVVTTGRVGVFGAPKFAKREEIENRITIKAKKSDKEVTLQLIEKLPDDLEKIISYMKPFLKDYTGPYGEATEFFFYMNKDSKGNMLVDPYVNEKISIDIKAGSGFPGYSTQRDTICDALFKSRICSNGKPAHVTWKYDPWTGEKLQE